MSAMFSKIELKPHYFKEKIHVLVESDGLKASIFRFNTGVCGIRLTNENGNIVMLPFQGQQIWSAEFDGRSLTMNSIFDEPIPTREYLENYGGFLLHCGLTAMGNPSPKDTHPVHGELPNAPYQKAYLNIGFDELGSYLEVGGKYYYKKAFTHHYVAEPKVKLYASATTVNIEMEVKNLYSKPLEYMYLSHINFCLVKDSEIVTSAIEDPQKVEVRKPNLSDLDETYNTFLQNVAENPILLNRIKEDLVLDPELVAFYSYRSDENGWAHSLQCLPDGYSHYVKHRPSELEHVVRWMVKTADEQALGLALPATAQSNGYIEEKKKGNVKVLAPKEKVKFCMEAGIIRPNKTEEIKQKIRDIKEYD